MAILSGAKYLQDISLAAHPLDKGVAVAQAWHQKGWADYTGLRRTLKKLTWAFLIVIDSINRELDRCIRYALEVDSALHRGHV
jgi:hypothetical protein